MKVTDDFRHYAGKDLESMTNAVNYYNWLIDEFGKYIKGNVVEVGAGSGTFSKYILELNPDNLYAVEPSDEMFPLLRDNLKEYKNVEVHNSFLGDLDKSLEGKIDSIFYINVMEHVEKDQEEMKIAYKFLKPGGHLCIYVPATQALYGSFDAQVGHYRRYSKKDLKNKLETAGFSLEKLHYSDIIGIIPWIVSFKLLKKKVLNNSSVLIYDKFIIPIITLQEKIFKPFIGKNLWAVAQKK